MKNRSEPVNKRRLAFCLFCIILWFGSVNAWAQSTREITVSAAISLKDAFQEIGKLFQKNQAGSRVLFNFGASGDLARQIEAGAPADVFASAARKDMDHLDRKGLLAVYSRADFARNAIVLVKPAASKIQMKSIQDLAKGEVKKIAIGNPKTVPAGRYAEEFLRYANVWSVIQDKLVFAENVRQVLDYVARDEVDAGLVYATDARNRPREVTTVITAPENSHEPIAYPIAAIKGAKAEIPARGFVQFVLSAQGQEILSKYGFQPISSVKEEGMRRR